MNARFWLNRMRLFILITDRTIKMLSLNTFLDENNKIEKPNKTKFTNKIKNQTLSNSNKTMNKEDLKNLINNKNISIYYQ